MLARKQTRQAAGGKRKRKKREIGQQKMGTKHLQQDRRLWIKRQKTNLKRVLKKRDTLPLS